jgi:cytosine permease
MASELPDYVASAQPNPMGNRAPWFKNTAQTYAGIMLWFVFWFQVPVGETLGGGGHSLYAGGTLAQGIGVALFGLILAAVVCHFLFYLVPGMLGMQTGLPLYIVGTSTYGVQGGFIMPGFIMGILQFGWLAVNAYFTGDLLCGLAGGTTGSATHMGISIAWALLGAFMGLKGIAYVARVATFLPLLPLAVLIILFFATMGGIGSFDAKVAVEAGAAVTVGEKSALAALPAWKIIALLGTYVVGFFATAGAAGTDFGMNNRDAKDVQLGGLAGITLATIVAGGLSLLIVAGAYGLGKAEDGVMQTTNLMGAIMGDGTAKFFWLLLAIAAFPPACFSAFIAANSFKTTLPKVNPWITVGVGTAGSIALVVSGFAGQAVNVFKIIGASFGPVCGAMAADYLLAGRKWAGPRAGFNPAGWISWVVGFAVGAADFVPALAGKIPCPPVAAFIVGFVLYMILAKAGMESKVLAMAGAGEEPAPAPEPEAAPAAEAPAEEAPAEEAPADEGEDEEV